VAITTLFLTGVEISARMYRGLITDLFGEGIRNVGAGEFRVIPRAAGANMTVTIQKGTGEDAVAYIKGDDVTGQGTYRIASDSDFPDLGVAAAPASGTRTDLVVLEVVDSQVVGGSTNVSRFRVLTGVSALTSEKTVIPLARISVPAGATSIQAANITDLRTIATGGGAAVRTAAEVLTQAQIDALTTAQKYRGRLIENSTVGRLQHIATDGSAPVDVGPLPPASGVTSVNIDAVNGSPQTLSFYVGPGYREVEWVGSTVNIGLQATLGGLALPDPLQSHLRGSGSNGSYSAGVPAGTTNALESRVAALNNAVYLYNVTYNTSDGLVRFTLAATGATTVSGTVRIGWRAR
jgi:hypothetical protein